MSRQQRAQIDAMLRRSALSTPPAVEDMRAGFQQLMDSMPVPDSIRVVATTLGARAALLVEPTGETQPGTILYFHGGSWVMGSPQTALSLTGSLVARTGIRSLSLDYRLAPEHPFPAAIEDTVDAYRTVLDRGIAPSSIAFVGDSAGGGLSITACLAARDAGLSMPAAVVTFSAGLDATRTGVTMETKAEADPLLTRAALERTAAMYLGGQDPRQPLLSPALLGDLTGFPPTLLQAGTNEMLLDDSVRFATRARDADVDVILDVTADVPHVFQSFAGILDEADEALDRAACFLRQRLRA